MKIVGICLVQNDDRFLRRVLENVVDFCDELILVEHKSTDKTPEICAAFRDAYAHVSYHRILHPSQSQSFLDRFVNTPTWVFGVDGDEIYDKQSLAVLKEQLLTGRFSDKWQVLGKVLHLTGIDFEKKVAKGYMARPSRPINKLYNFSLIKQWRGPCSERLHNGEIEFLDPAHDRQNKDESECYLEWDCSVFRCLHAAFVWRSSINEQANHARPNIEEVRQYSRINKVWYKLRYQLGMNIESNTKGPYQQGAIETVSIASFFPESEVL